MLSAAAADPMWARLLSSRVLAADDRRGRELGLVVQHHELRWSDLLDVLDGVTPVVDDLGHPLPGGAPERGAASAGRGGRCCGFSGPGRSPVWTPLTSAERYGWWVERRRPPAKPARGVRCRVCWWCSPTAGCWTEKRRNGPGPRTRTRKCGRWRGPGSDRGRSGWDWRRGRMSILGWQTERYCARCNGQDAWDCWATGSPPGSSTWPTRRLWRGDPPGGPAADYRPLNAMARHRVDLAKIGTYWAGHAAGGRGRWSPTGSAPTTWLGCSAGTGGPARWGRRSPSTAASFGACGEGRDGDQYGYPGGDGEGDAVRAIRDCHDGLHDDCSSESDGDGDRVRT